VDEYFNAIIKLVGEASEDPVEANNVIPDIAQVFYNGLADNLKTNQVEQALPALPPASLPDKLLALCVLKEAAEEQEKDINSTRKIASAAVAAQSSRNSNRQTTNMISDANTFAAYQEQFGNESSVSDYSPGCGHGDVSFLKAADRTATLRSEEDDGTDSHVYGPPMLHELPPPPDAHSQYASMCMYICESQFSTFD
jgi:hypothetical protein